MLMQIDNAARVSVDVQEMARYLFSATLSKMESQEKSAAIEYWRAHRMCWFYVPSALPSKLNSLP